MNIFQFVPLVNSLDSTVATVSVAVLAVFLLSIILNMLDGMRRGTLRQLVRFGFTVGAVIISYIATASLGDKVAGWLDFDKIASLIPGANQADGSTSLLSSIPDEMIEQILLPVGAITTPLAFVIIFLLIKLLFEIMCTIVCKVLNFKKANSNPQRLGGAVLAAIEGILVFAVLLLPFGSALNVLDEAYCEAISDEEADASEELVRDYEANILPLTKNPAVTFVGNLGGKALASGFSTVEYEGKACRIDRELKPIVRFLVIDNRIDGGIEWKSLTDEDKAALTKFAGAVGESDYLSNLFVSFTSGCTDIIKDAVLGLGEVNLGTSGDDVDEAIESNKIINSLMDFIGGITVESYGEDIETVLDLYFMLSDRGVLVMSEEEEGDITDIILGKAEDDSSLIAELKTILQANPRSAPITRAITETLLLSMVDTDTGEEVDYDELKSDVTEVLKVNKEDYADEVEYKDALSSTLDTTLRDHGITLNDNELSEVTDYVDENYAGKESLTDEEFNDILFEYYDIYLKYLETGEVE